MGTIKVRSESRGPSCSSERPQLSIQHLQPIRDPQTHPPARQLASNHHNVCRLENRRSLVRFAPLQLGPRTLQLTLSTATTATSQSHRASFADRSRRMRASLLSAEA